MAVSTIPSSISFLKDDRGEFIPVSCGQLEVGKLYIVKLRNALGPRAPANAFSIMISGLVPLTLKVKVVKLNIKTGRSLLIMNIYKHLLSIYAQLRHKTENLSH